MVPIPRPLPMKSLRALLCLSLFFSAQLRADVTVPPVFSDHAVLQHGVAVPVWGTAAPGEKVTVTYLAQKQETTADAAGKWRVKLEPLAPLQNGELVIAGTNTLTIKDVLTGEVWVCSGQSNMAMTVKSSANSRLEIPAADHPQIRMFKSPRVQKDGTTDGGTWEVCSPETVGNFSGVGYYFARSLNEALQQPVGMLSASVGGTPVEAWTKGGGLYRSLVEPFIPYAIRGAIWYQGEANARPSPAAAAAYEAKLTKLIEGWRRDWGYDFPFAWVQLPNYEQRQTEPVEELSQWAAMREAMLKVKKMPNTGMAIAIDLGGGEKASLHPGNKQDVGKRLAAWARAKVYGHKDMTESGPIPAGSEIKGREIIVSFDHAAGGLVAKDGELKSFAITGEDHRWFWADARIEGDKVILSSAEVARPIAARYAWAQNPIASLYNGAGLAATPFRTDDFPLSAEVIVPPPKPRPSATPAPSPAQP